LEAKLENTIEYLRDIKKGDGEEGQALGKE